jgi:hypothetical protein
MARTGGPAYLRGMSDTEHWLAQRAFQRRQTALGTTSASMFALGVMNWFQPHNMGLWVLLLGAAAVSGSLWLLRRMRNAQGS